jgi:hypothetical protein
MNKKIITIASIVFALIFIVILAVMMGTITNKANSANTKLVDTLEMSDGMELSNYDNGVIKGSGVVNAIKNGKSIAGSQKIWMMVVTKKNNTKKVYGYGELGSGSTTTLYYNDGSSTKQEFEYNVKSNSDTYVTYDVTDNNSADYINEQVSFKSYLVKNKNNVVLGIYFIQQ